jgi:hypothetical protein
MEFPIVFAVIKSLWRESLNIILMTQKRRIVNVKVTCNGVRASKASIRMRQAFPGGCNETRSGSILVRVLVTTVYNGYSTRFPIVVFPILSMVSGIDSFLLIMVTHICYRL